MRLNKTKSLVIVGFLFCISSLLFTPFAAEGLESDQPSQNISINAEIYKSIKDLEGTIGGSGFEEVSYTVFMEEEMEYFFTLDLNLAITGLFSIQINRPGELFGFESDYAIWASGDAAIEKHLAFNATADTTGEHTFIITSGSTASAATYILNFGCLTCSGLDWWWYAVIGGGGLVVLITIIAIASASKKKKKKSKKKSKKKK